MRRSALSFFLSVTCLVSVVVSVPAYAAEPVTDLPKPSPGRSVATRPVPYRFAVPHDDSRTSYKPAATTLPQASTASVSLSPVRKKAPGAPVWAQAVSGFGADTQADVRIPGPAVAEKVGVAGVLIAVTVRDQRSGRARVGVDYAGFAQAYGGNYGSRLRLVQLPSCALTTPDLAVCQTRTPLVSANDPAAKSVSAEVSLAAGTSVVVAAVTDPATEGGKDSGGSYAASDLKPSGSWAGGSSTGSFTYSYPISVPPAPSGLVPSVGLSYDSGSVDGQTVSTQAQASWVGDGWGTPSSYVEQTFVSCSDNPGGEAAPEKTADLCYDGPIMTLSLNGSTQRLIWDEGKKVWKAEDDKGEVIERSTGFDNGTTADDKNYWTVVTRDGTKYMFGRNRLPGWSSGKPVTKSVDTLPVYSPHAGDPCYDETFKDAQCTMARRWNLDYVVDVSGNAMAYYYDQKTNFYGRHKGDTDTEYVRDSYLDRIDYGFRDNGAYGTVPNQVKFETAGRCVQATCAALSSTTKASYPDVPFDLICEAGKNCTPQAPSFFSTERLTQIVTKQYDVAAAKHLPVDTYDLAQTIPTTGDGTSPTLWLSSVTRTGHEGNASIALPAMTFASTRLPNRSVATDGFPEFYRHRLTSITTETGSVISAAYELPKPCASVSALNPATNTSSCYPVRWTPDGLFEPKLDWFNKYAVTRVTQTDPTGGAAATATSYQYDGGAAWHFDDNEVVKAKYRTYGQFRGYAKVTTYEGDGVNDRRTKSESLFYRGMSKNNNSTVVNLEDSLGGQHEDHNELAGRVLETLTYQGEGGPLDNSAVTSYWVSGATATRSRTDLPALTANWVAPVLNVSRQRITSATGTTWRTHAVDTSYDTTPGSLTLGSVKHVYSHTVPADAKYDRCTINSYAPANLTANLVDLVSQIETLAVPCGGYTAGSPVSVPGSVNTLTAPASVSRPAQVVSLTRKSYDDYTWSETFPQTVLVSRGLVTMERQAKDYVNGAYTWQILGRTHYDAVGRADDAYDGKGNKTHTDYTVNSVGLVTGMSVAQPLDHTTSSTVNPRRGLTVTSTDINEVVSTQAYDALGRTTSVWLNNRTTAQNANYKFGYTVSKTGISATTTERTNNSNAYLKSVTLYDALLRPRQTQAETPQGGRLVSDTFYDTHGWVTKEYEGYWDDNVEPTVGNVVDPYDPNVDIPVPSQNYTTYDGLGRVVMVERMKDNQSVSRTFTVHNGDRTTIVPPTGGTVTTTVADPLGRTTTMREYTTRPSLNTPSDYFTGTFSVSGGTSLATTYEFDSRGLQGKVVDTKGNPWTTKFNLLGQITEKTDPDAGATKDMQYDANGNLTQSTDARGKTISFQFDALNRPTASFAGTTQLTKSVYDNSNNAVPGMTFPKGQLTTSIAYSAGLEYKTQAANFNVFGSSLGETVSIPGQSALAGDYAFTHLYYPNNGLLFRDTFPAKGGLPAETVAYSYDKFDQVQVMTGLNPYLQSTTEDAYGRINQTVIGTGTNQAAVDNLYDEHTGLLKKQTTTRKPTAPSGIDEQEFKYDPAGNLLAQTSTRLAANSIAETQCFAYDGLRRLTEAWTATDKCATTPTSTNRAMLGNTIGGASAYWTSWRFDDLGNRTSEVKHALTGTNDTTTTYKYDENGAGQPHTLTSTATTGATTGSATYKYDVAGNMTVRNAGNGNQTLAWTDEGKLGSVTSAAGTSTSIYNANGDLLLQDDPTTTTLYLGAQQHVLTKATGAVTGTRYQTLAGAGTVIRTGSGTAYTFALANTQGTPTLYLNNTAQTPTWRQYTPYGGPRGATITAPDNRGFLNKPLNASTGLTNVGAREYDPVIGRFISVDPIQDLQDPQQWNGYAYANNNPTTLSDPSGLIAKEPREGGGGTGYHEQPGDIGGGGDSAGNGNGGGSSDSGDHGSNNDDGGGNWFKKTWKKTKKVITDHPQITGFVAGAVTGAVCLGAGGIAAGPAGLAACGAIAGAVGSIATDWAAGTSTKDMLVNAAESAALGGAAGVLIPNAGSVARNAGSMARGAKAFITGGTRQTTRQAESQAAKTVLSRESSEAGTTQAGKCLHSFAPNTPVLLAGGSAKPIEDVEVGDEVVSTDPGTGTTTAKTVEALHINEDTDLTDLTVSTEDGEQVTLNTTQHHPFWSITRDEWVDAAELRPDEHLTEVDGAPVTVVAVKNFSGNRLMRDLTVADIHTYYVLAGRTPVLVHNCGETMDFAHGTTTAHAESIAQNGLSSTAAKASSSGGSVAQPGNFFTYRVTGGGDPNLSVAAQWGVTRNGGAREGASVVITRMCKCTYDRLVKEGHITTRVTGEGMPEETIFGPGALPFLKPVTQFPL
ncbi:RHS repeat-associated core domain-containing protein [Paractinoplanes brasiliensis]|uniref:RHS repeat-associated protein n=1 Tax=Paractinoplanes brasiliensis TaxID=52695 RepID=A0A4R6JSR4_9ACTN|nr:RHS repeat-associated core domain-containing protein [Actinoplanes brasiliensis]TDO39650.1 RHS repeat-associated protein [Actinoplanes brasiliensis]